MSSAQLNEKALRAIENLPLDWHDCGTVSNKMLRAITRHVRNMGVIEHSLETGSGRTTLLFSHLSKDHLVFALNAGESVSKVLSSELFYGETVTYIEGSTQKTLPQFHFSNKLELALIDGPHGYPFPDLEYFYIYPLIKEKGLLLIDDIKIPSVRRMFDMIKADRMFQLVDIVDGNMAFFRRTNAPLIDPFGDSWWLQGYNQAYYQQVMLKVAVIKRLKRVLRAFKLVRK